MLPEDHYFMILVVAAVLALDVVAIVMYIRTKP